MTSPARASTSASVAVLGASVLVIVLVTWASSIGPDRVVSGGRLQRLETDTPSATVLPSETTDPREEARDRDRPGTPEWMGVLAVTLELLTLGVLLFLVGRLAGRLRRSWLVRTRRRRRVAAADVEFDVLGSGRRVAEVMADDAEEQRAELLFDEEPRNAIVGCWHRFERQAERGGVERRPWQTTAEFVLGALDLVGADSGAVTRLADLYREARFSDHPITDDRRREALAALDTIHACLRPALR